MKPSYQLLALGTPYYITELQEALQIYPYISFIDAPELIDERQPLLCLYYGATKEDKNKLYPMDLKRRALNQEVLPIVDNPVHFNDYIPSDIGTVNAFILSDATKVERLKNRILSWFGLLDSTRKIFVSYKRSDTSALAHQLFDSLIKMGYIPFLDSYSIESGVDFQEYLMNEISDADMFIMLNSSNYDQSEYAKAELVAASHLGIGILQVTFPESKYFPEALFSFKMSLNEQLASQQKYSDEIINEIIYQMEIFRAQGFQTKRRILIDGLRSRYAGMSLTTLEDGSVIVEEKESVYYPVTHVPTSEDLELAYRSMQKLNLPPSVMKHICYYGIHCRHNKRNHLKWLNDCKLPVYSEDISE